MNTEVEKVLKCHFGEIELLVVLKSLLVRKYFDKFLDELSRVSQIGVKFQNT